MRRYGVPYDSLEADCLPDEESLSTTARRASISSRTLSEGRNRPPAAHLGGISTVPPTRSPSPWSPPPSSADAANGAPPSPGGCEGDRPSAPPMQPHRTRRPR